ncbi:MFS transporter [Anaerolinea thermophila]|uniref:Major facilitator superfamily transporter n=1 Tax=Anaerolinea thermophila (strain DSM 14523 / JCM 11388 / NBRC 100420 / UNI-1) TaxID=926569 RepID=E8N4H1_ANATU|nr:MFS transporter [Anaerolinea thermophila]BAJ63335.1 major facilitator superfamily transporter [Anaerolinea thermophila UNI-1]
MKHSRFFRFSLFALIYFAEGAILSYFTALNGIYLLSFDVSMTQIGLIGSIALLPFVLKIFLGLISDRFNLFHLGHRKPYILIGLIVQFVCLLVVPHIHPGQQFALFAFLAFLLMSGQALYDTSTDGLALDTTAPEEEGTVQGIMVGGRALGVVLISSIIGWVAQNASWMWMFYLLALLTLIPLPLVLSLRESERTAQQRFTWQGFSAFKSREVIALGILGALYSMIINAANQIVNPFLQQTFQISVSFAGFTTTIWGIGVILGGLLGGLLTDRLGQSRSVIAAVLLSLTSIFGLSLTPNAFVALFLVMVFGFAFGYYETVYFATSMRVTDPRIAATMFAILMGIANLGTGIGLALSGSLSDWIGFRNTFIVFALLNLLAFPLLPWVFPGRVMQKVKTP